MSRFISSRALLLSLITAFLSAVVPAGGARAALTEDEAYEIGVAAYTYAYPLVTRRVATNVTQPEPQLLRAPMDQFSHAPRYPDATFKDIVRPNADTLYSMLWFDVGREPLVFAMPDTAGVTTCCRSWICGPTCSPPWVRAPPAPARASSFWSVRAGKARRRKACASS